MIRRRRRRDDQRAQSNILTQRILDSLERMSVGPLEDIPYSIEDEIRMTPQRWIPNRIDVESLKTLLPEYNSIYEESTDVINTEHLRLGERPMYKERVGIDDSIQRSGWTIRVARSIEYEPVTDQHYKLLGLNRDNTEVNIERIKKRLTIYVGTCQVMITQVDQTGRAPQIEFEIELDRNSEDECITESISVIERIVAIIRRLQRQITSWIGWSQEWSGQFFGSLPVAYRNKDMKTIKTGRYFVQVKLDGIRYLLVNYENRVWLISRSEGLILTTLEPHGNMKYMIDCESSQGMFMAFDMLAMNNDSLINLPYSTRYNRLLQLIQELDEDQSFIDVNTTVPVSKIRDLTDYIDIDTKTYTIDDELPVFHTDGLIFQHDGSYVQRTDPNVFKWKFPDMISIDCQVRNDPNYSDSTCPESILYVQGPGQNNPILFSDRVSDECHTGIGEYIYDKNESVWKRIRDRSDKNRANYITTAFDTLTSLMEDVTLDEIITELVN